MSKIDRIARLMIAAAFAALLLFALPTAAFADEVSDAAAGDDMTAQASPYKNKYASYWDAVSAFMADKRFAPGTPWGDDDTPKLDSDNYNSGCAAYVTDYGIFVFGSDAFDWDEYDNPSEIQAGDCIRFYNPRGDYNHSVAVIARNGSQLETLEGNYGPTVQHSYTRYTVYGNTLFENGSAVEFEWGNRAPDLYSYDFDIAKVRMYVVGYRMEDPDDSSRMISTVEYFMRIGKCTDIDGEPYVNVSYAGHDLTEGLDYEVTGYKISDTKLQSDAGDTRYYQSTQVVRLKGLGMFAGQSRVCTGTVYWYTESEDDYSKAPTVTRLSGDAALDTMKKVVETGKFKTGGTVVLANVWGYHDALTAAGIAGLEGAPVVMTDGNALSAQAKSLLQSLKPSRIVVCGGTGTVSKAVADAAKAAAGAKELVRASGSNAAGTAVDIFKKGSGWADTAIIATSGTYHDALAAAPLSYAAHLPIFMTEWTGALSDATLKAMRDGGIKKAYIAGGTYWIPDSTKAQLEKAGITVVKRLSGDTAVETSSAIAAEAIAKFGMTADNLGVATTSSHYDALAGAAFCGSKKSVMLLVNDEQSSSITSFMWDRWKNIDRVYVFGGNGSVSDATYDMIKAVVW